MNTHRAAFGDTWRVRYGSRAGIQLRTSRGIERVRPRDYVWLTTPGPESDFVGLGDALSDAQKAARARVNRVAGSYRLPQVPKNREEAVMAYILLMRSAASEDSRLRGTLRGLGSSAAWRYRSSSVSQILAQARTTLQRAKAPRTLQLLDAVDGGGRSAAPPRPTPRPTPPYVEQEIDLPAETSASVVVPALDLPSWAPYAAIAAVGSVLLLVLVRRRRPSYAA